MTLMLPPLTEGDPNRMHQDDMNMLGVLAEHGSMERLGNTGTALVYNIQVVGEEFCRVGMIHSTDKTGCDLTDNDWWRKQLVILGKANLGVRFDVGSGKTFEGVVWPNLLAALTSEDHMPLAEGLLSIIGDAYPDYRIFGISGSMDRNTRTATCFETYGFKNEVLPDGR